MKANATARTAPAAVPAARWSVRAVVWPTAGMKPGHSVRIAQFPRGGCKAVVKTISTTQPAAGSAECTAASPSPAGSDATRMRATAATMIVTAAPSQVATATRTTSSGASTEYSTRLEGSRAATPDAAPVERPLHCTGDHHRRHQQGRVPRHQRADGRGGPCCEPDPALLGERWMQGRDRHERHAQVHLRWCPRPAATPPLPAPPRPARCRRTWPANLSTAAAPLVPIVAGRLVSFGSRPVTARRRRGCPADTGEPCGIWRRADGRC